MLYAVCCSRGAQAADRRQSIVGVLSSFRPSCCCLPCWLGYIADADLSQQRRAQQIDARHLDTGFQGSILVLHGCCFVVELVFCRNPINNAAIRIDCPEW